MQDLSKQIYFKLNLYKGTQTDSHDKAAYLHLAIPGRWEELI